MLMPEKDKNQRSGLLLDAARSLLLIVDVQEKFRAVVTGIDDVIAGCGLLMRAARRLDVPILVSEQYPKALGPTVRELQEFISRPEDAYDKLSFSAMGCAGLAERIRESRRTQIVVAGVETHVCVLETVFDLQAVGTQVYMVADAVSSRKAVDKDTALRRMEMNGVQLVTIEMVVFEWLKAAGTAEFKELQALIK